MADVLVPGWVFVVLIPGLAGWIVWVTVNTFKNGSDIKLNEANDISFRAEIREDIKEIKTGFQSLQNSIVSVLGQEITLLKNMNQK